MRPAKPSNPPPAIPAKRLPAARRQKWIDQSQSVNLFLATPDMSGDVPHRNLNRTPRRAWNKGLKTTYYLRTLQASNNEKATIDVETEVHDGIAASTSGKIPGPYSLGFGGYTAERKMACSIDAMMNGEPARHANEDKPPRLPVLRSLGEEGLPRRYAQRRNCEACQ
jgi:ribonucleotide reductase alpha subunit